jgi:hypothetical protein
MAGWVNRSQQDVIEYLQAENRVLRDHLGGRRLMLSDAQRRLLAPTARRLGVCRPLPPRTQSPGSRQPADREVTRSAAGCRPNCVPRQARRCAEIVLPGGRVGVGRFPHTTGATVLAEAAKLTERVLSEVACWIGGPRLNALVPFAHEPAGGRRHRARADRSLRSGRPPDPRSRGHGDGNRPRVRRRPLRPDRQPRASPGRRREAGNCDRVRRARAQA